MSAVESKLSYISLFAGFEAQARQQRGEDDDLDHYIPAAFLHIECPPYEDPPPPYSPPQPPHLLPEESPPPYQELESISSDLDANANISNNNNNNDQTCTEHQQEGGTSPTAAGPDPDRSAPSQSFGTNIVDIIDAFNRSSESGSGDFCSHIAGGGRNSGPLPSSKEDETELQLISRRESCPLDQSAVPFHQDYSLFAGGSSRCVASTASEQTHPKEALSHVTLSEVPVIPDPRHRNSDGFGGTGSRGGARGVRKTGRSCSFSFTHHPDEDVSMAGMALAPMAHSYHAATTADSGVQTHGSYTASLSRHRARAANASQVKSTLKEEAEGSPQQRMLTKPLVKCDASVQQSHRLLQEELRRSLPPAFVSAGEGHPQGSCTPSNPGSVSAGSHGSVVVGSHGNTMGSNHLGKAGSCSPDPDIGISLSSPEHVAEVPAHLPRSQSVNSTLSVCSETGEVRLKRAMAEGEHTVLQNDSQYPDHGLPRSSPPHPNLADDHRHDMSSHDNPSSLPNYTFPSSAAHFPGVDNPPCAHRSDPPVPRAKTAAAAATVTPRRPVPNPPSQELRTGAAAPNGRSHSMAKPRHKKIHFVPLEKSKTFKAKKEKGNKGSKKGEIGQTARHHDSGGSRPDSFAHSHAAAMQDSSEPRMHQPKLADIMRGRLSANAQSVKQYGFLDNFASGPQEDAGMEPSPRNADVGKDLQVVAGVGVGARPVSNPYHSLPHKAHSHSPAGPHHPAGHRRQVSHGDKPSHANPATVRLRNKPRPLSGGLVVEPGRDPADPAAALPQNSVARRRVKTLHLKKGRQSYPDSATMADKKVNCVDLGFVEPSHDLGRTVGADSDAHTLPAKRRGTDRGCDRAGVGSGPSGFLEGQMSSYV